MIIVMLMSYDKFISYGIIAFLRMKSEIKFLLFQRRDTFEYIDFVRGLWGTEEDVVFLLSHMSTDERQRLREFTIEELWKDLWISETKYYPSNPFGYQRAIKKYSEIRDRLQDLLDGTTTDIRFPPWGFPKGKPQRFERPVDTAIREFSEETTLTKKYLKVFTNIDPIIETYNGSDTRFYCTQYFLAEYKSLEKTPYLRYIETPTCIRKISLSAEAFEAGWFTLNEASEKLNARKYNILKQAKHIIAQL